MTTFTRELHSGWVFLANEIATNLKSTSRLKFKSTGLECSDANKTPTTSVELKGNFESFSQPIETLQRLNQLAVV